MLKPIFDEYVDFFSKKIILCAKGGEFKKGALDSDFMFVNIEPYKSNKCVHIKLSKYCDIDARLIFSYIFNFILFQISICTTF